MAIAGGRRLYGKKKRLGGYPGSNREHTVPHSVVLPIELYSPYDANVVGLKKTHKIFIDKKHNKHILCWSDSNTQ